MSSAPEQQIAPVRTENPGEMHMVGLSGQFSGPAGMSDLWGKFVPYLGKIPGEMGDIAWGIIFPPDANGSFKYMTAVRLPDFTTAPPELERVTIPVQSYNVFEHTGNVDQISSTIAQICRTGLFHSPASTSQVGMLEYYGPKFDPMSGTGDLEIWVPSRP